MLQAEAPLPCSPSHHGGLSRAARAPGTQAQELAPGLCCSLARGVFLDQDQSCAPALAGTFLPTETFTGSSNAPAPPGGGRAPPATSAGALPASQGVRATSDSTPAGSRPPPLEQSPENLLHRPLMGRRCTGRLTGNTSRGLRPKGSHLQQGYDGRFRKRPCHCWLRCSIVSRSIRVQSSPFRIGVQRASLCSRARISAGVSRVSLAACTASGNLAAEAGARQQRGGLGREGR